MRIKMTTGLSGPTTSLSIGDTPTMDDVAGQRLIDAGFAELHPDEVEPVVEPAPAPAPEPVVEPTAEPAPEPVAETVAEPVAEPSPAPKQTRRKAS